MFTFGGRGFMLEFGWGGAAGLLESAAGLLVGALGLLVGVVGLLLPSLPELLLDMIYIN